MNAGFVALWIAMVFIVLITTGWKEYIIPDMAGKRLTLLFVLVLGLLVLSYGWLLPFGSFSVKLQAAAAVLLLTAVYWLASARGAGQLFYLVSCITLLAFIWGTVYKIYSYDPVFVWLDPKWDAPIVCGLLAGILTAKAKEQLSVLLWSAALSEVLFAILQGGGYTAWVGSWKWWDGFMIALAAARSVSLLLKALRAMTARFGLLQ